MQQSSNTEHLIELKGTQMEILKVVRYMKPTDYRISSIVRKIS